MTNVCLLYPIFCQIFPPACYPLLLNLPSEVKNISSIFQIYIGVKKHPPIFFKSHWSGKHPPNFSNLIGVEIIKAHTIPVKLLTFSF